MNMTVVKTVFGHQMIIGGDQHSGWSPTRAATAQSPRREVAFNFEIQSDGFGYLLCYVSEAGDLYGDTWYETLNGAMAAAAEAFGVRDDQWQTAVDSSPG
jgi:hypothetical protein